MTLGILVTTDRHLRDVLGLGRAALAQGHDVSLFAMDAGVNLLATPDLRALAEEAGVTMSYCNLSTRGREHLREGLPGAIESGSQYQNARMVHNADRVVVL